MDCKKIGIVGFAVMAGLSFIATGAGMKLDKKTQPSLNNIAGHWIPRLDPLVAPFAPPLEISGLLCNGRPAGQFFSLTPSRTNCRVEIPPDQTKSHRQGTLQFKTEPRPGAPPLQVYLRSDKEHCDFSSAEIGPALALKITFSPKENPEPKEDCWTKHADPEKPLRFVVLKAGGLLFLDRQCDGCGLSDARIVWLRITS